MYVVINLWSYNTGYVVYGPFRTKRAAQKWLNSRRSRAWGVWLRRKVRKVRR